MDKSIEQTEKLLSVINPKSKKVTDINLIISYISNTQNKNPIIYLPFDNFVGENYFEYIPIIILDIKDEKIFFTKTFKTTIINLEKDKIDISQTQEESITIKELIELSEKKEIIAFIEQ